jgi:stage II sporulation protein D
VKRSGLRVLLALFLLAPLPAPAESGRVRVSVLGLLRPQELVVRPVAGAVLVVEAGGETLVLESGQGLSVQRAGQFIQVTTFRGGVTGALLRARGRQGGDVDLVLSVPGRIERRFRGRLEVQVANDALLPMIEMDLETAVASAVAAESPPAAPLEALKAQAVASRSFYVASRGRHEQFDYCDTTHCQFLRQPPGENDPAAVASRDTHGLALYYGGEPVAALYTASCGGKTRTLADVGLESGGYPFFRVVCAYCQRHAPEWTAHIEAGPVAELLSAHRSENARLVAGRQKGWSTVPSNNYSTEWQGGTLLVRGRGRGHGVGLCQEGAAALAAAGADFRQVLQHYYPNTALLSHY